MLFPQNEGNTTPFSLLKPRRDHPIQNTEYRPEHHPTDLNKSIYKIGVADPVPAS
jgi:hypothetical protein